SEPDVERGDPAPLHRDRAVVRRGERRVARERDLGIRIALVLRRDPEIAARERQGGVREADSLAVPGRDRVRQRDLAQLDEVRRHDVALRLLAAEQAELVLAPGLVLGVRRIEARIVPLLAVQVGPGPNRADRAPLVVTALVVQEDVELQVVEEPDRVRQPDETGREGRSDELLLTVLPLVRLPALALLEERDAVGAEDRTALLVTLHVDRPVAAERVAFA